MVFTLYLARHSSTNCLYALCKGNRRRMQYYYPTIGGDRDKVTPPLFLRSPRWIISVCAIEHAVMGHTCMRVRLRQYKEGGKKAPLTSMKVAAQMRERTLRMAVVPFSRRPTWHCRAQQSTLEQDYTKYRRHMAIR